MAAARRMLSSCLRLNTLARVHVSHLFLLQLIVIVVILVDIIHIIERTPGFGNVLLVWISLSAYWPKPDP